MCPTYNPLLQLVPNRITRLRQQLAGLLWTDFESVPVFGGPVNAEFLPLAEGMRQPMREVLAGERFGKPTGAWQQRWFRVEVPSAKTAAPRHLHWDCNGETTVYLDGKPYAGLDVAHTTVPVPARPCTLWLDCGTYQTCVWHPGKGIDPLGLRFDGARVAARHEAAWDVYWDLEVLAQWMEHLLRQDNLSEAIKPWGPYPEVGAASPILRRLLRLLDEAHEAWELRGLTDLGRLLKAIFAAYPAESWQMTATLSGHSHLDLVWFWPEEVGERKTVHTFATALRLLEQYPEYRFLWTSPVSYAVLKHREPALLDDVRKAIAAGRWEATGGAWVETDTMLSGGEALARALVLGQRAFVEIRGEPSRVLWLPDCFGFSANLPQLMQLAGLRYFATSKIGWNAVSVFPYHSFNWRSADGTEVLAHTFSAGDSPGALAFSARNYRQSDANRELMGYMGVGDGGGGTTVASIEQLRRLGNLAQTPRAAWGSAEAFLERLETKRAHLPTYEGELYLEFHRGVFTSQAAFKLAHRWFEAALQSWEAVRVVSGGGPLPEEQWQRLAFSQFHDALPGSSIALVYQQLGHELRQRTADCLSAAQHELAEAADVDPSQPGVTVFNPLAFARTVVVDLPGATQPQPVSLPLRGLETVVVDLPVAPAPAATWCVGNTILDNGVIRATFDTAGRLISVRDAAGAWPLADPCDFVLHPDYPPNFDAWDIDHGAVQRRIGTAGPMTLRVVEQGPVRAILRGEATLGERSRLQLDYVLEAGADSLRLDITVDWHEQARLLKFAVPGSARGRQAFFGAPYGTVARTQVPGLPRDEAAWEVPATRWAATGDDSGRNGLLLLFERTCGVSCRDGFIGLSLLRSPQDPAHEFPAQCVADHRPQHSPDNGTHRIRLALARFTGLQSAPAARAEALFVSPVMVPGAARKLPAPPFQVRGLASVIPAWVVPSDGGGYIVRLHEAAGCSGNLQLEFAVPPRHVAAVDLLEQPQSRTAVRQTSPRLFACMIGAHQLLSLRVRK